MCLFNYQSSGDTRENIPMLSRFIWTLNNVWVDCQSVHTKHCPVTLCPGTLSTWILPTTLPPVITITAWNTGQSFLYILDFYPSKEINYSQSLGRRSNPVSFQRYPLLQQCIDQCRIINDMLKLHTKCDNTGIFSLVSPDD